MKFKKVKGRLGFSYQCYVVVDGKQVRIARIDEPDKDERGWPQFWGVRFVGGNADGRVHNLLKITNKIKKLAKEYYYND